MQTSTLQKDFKILKHRIPDKFVYEIIEGKSIYYRDYQDVINLKKEFDEIMGSSALQSIIIELIVRKLYKEIDLKKYKLLYNELGIHLEKNNNIAADISIFEKEQIFATKKIEDKYITVPPKTIVEIDTKADLTNFDDVLDYYTVKTKKLFEFGVEGIFWILTKNKHIIEAKPNQDWLIKTWDRKISHDCKYS